MFALLSDIDLHWRLSSRFEVVELRTVKGIPERGAYIRVHGPLGITRMIETAVTEIVAPVRVAGTARSGNSCGRVSWECELVDATTTDVTVRIDFDRLSRHERLLVAVAGPLWLAGELARTLEALELAVQARVAVSDAART